MIEIYSSFLFDNLYYLLDFNFTTTNADLMITILICFFFETFFMFLALDTLTTTNHDLSDVSLSPANH